MKISVLIICVWAALISTGCGNKKTKLLLSEKWQPFAQTDRTKEREFVGPILVAAFDGKFEELDKLADELYRKKTLHRDGSWAINDFFSAFTEYDSYNQADPEKWQPVLEQRLQSWVSEHPESASARIAMSGFYGDYAWAVINRNEENTLSEEQMLDFGNRLRQSFYALQGTNQLPSAWTLLTALARPAGVQKKDVLELFPLMQEADPSFWHLYTEVVSQYLVPWRQGANHKEWNEWLVSVLNHENLSSVQSDSIYARIVLNLMHYDYRRKRLPNPYEAAGVDWERLQRGTRKLLSDFPKSTRIPTYYLSASVLKGDEVGIQEALLALKYSYDPGLWSGKGDSEFFELLESLKLNYPSIWK